MNKIHYLFFIVLCLLSGVTACSDDVMSEYSRYHAFFRYMSVNTTPPLRAALNGAGMFCKVTFSSKFYIFTDMDGRVHQEPRTAQDAYGRPIYISGFIVGTPELGTAGPVAYDLVCPNCYKESFIQRNLEFKSNVEMRCAKCERVYGLNNDGIVIDGKGGDKLFKYRMTYLPVQGILTIQN